MGAGHDDDYDNKYPRFGRGKKGHESLVSIVRSLKAKVVRDTCGQHEWGYQA